MRLYKRQFNVTLPEYLYVEAKMISIRNHVSMAELVRQSLINQIAGSHRPIEKPTIEKSTKQIPVKPKFRSHKMKLASIVSIILLTLMSASKLSAQTLVSATLEIYQPGATAPFMSNVISMAPTQTTCNLAALPPIPNVVFNPNKIYFNDPVNAGRFCLSTVGTFLASIPVIPGSYTGTLTFTDDRGLTSARSVPSPPFWRGTPTVIVAPSGVTFAP